ncbi:MAG: NAD-binding protein, partial [Candidatus Margulisiibacteriota bacterium]
MHIIIIGCGRVGSQLAQILSAEGHNIVIIDKNAKSFKRLGPDFNGITITGVGFDPDILKRAGIER